MIYAVICHNRMWHSFIDDKMASVFYVWEEINTSVFFLAQRSWFAFDMSQNAICFWIIFDQTSTYSDIRDSNWHSNLNQPKEELNERLAGLSSFDILEFVFIGPESDHWECLSVTHWLTHSLIDFVTFSKLDWCDPGVWRCQLKTCWGCYCCRCWCWGSCWQQFVNLGADVWSQS